MANDVQCSNGHSVDVHTAQSAFDRGSIRWRREICVYVCPDCGDLFKANSKGATSYGVRGKTHVTTDDLEQMIDAALP